MRAGAFSFRAAVARVFVPRGRGADVAAEARNSRSGTRVGHARAWGTRTRKKREPARWPAPFSFESTTGYRVMEAAVPVLVVTTSLQSVESLVATFTR